MPSDTGRRTADGGRRGTRGSCYENYGVEAGPTGYGGPQVRAMVEAALADVAAADPGHPRLPEVRHLLGYFLYRQGRYRAAR